MRLVVLLFCVLFSGCGYGFRSNSNIWEKEKIHTIYISPLTNDSMHPGVESLFTSALIKEFSKGGRIKLTSRKSEAEGILTGVLQNVDSKKYSDVSGDQVSKDLIEGEIAPPANFVIAREYLVSTTLYMHLSHKDGRNLWGQGFNRTKVFLSANQAGDIGNTGVLINDSRFQFSLEEIASKIALEVHDLFFESF